MNRTKLYSSLASRLQPKYRSLLAAAVGLALSCAPAWSQSAIDKDANDILVNFTDFGKSVTIDVPPAAETADFADLLKGLEG